MGTEQGMEWDSVAKVVLEMTYGDNPSKLPTCGWFKTRKGRGYGVYDNKSHGAPHPMNSPAFWETKKPFAEKYGVAFDGFGQPAPATEAEQRAQTLANIQKVMDVLHKDQALVDYLADTLVALGDSVPETIPGCKVCGPDPFKDERIYDYRELPGRPLRCARAPRWPTAPPWPSGAPGSMPSARRTMTGRCSSSRRPTWRRPPTSSASPKAMATSPASGATTATRTCWARLLPQEITEFTNAGIAAGMATVNFADDPTKEFNGFYTGTSTYGSFIYLHYGFFRLFSQLAQDCELKVGKILWVAGHSGPETADDSRTHFGIFAPGAAQLFPKGSIINLHPWEYNEVPVMLAAAFAADGADRLPAPDPPAHHHARSPGAGHAVALRGRQGRLRLRPYKAGQPKMGTVIVQGTSTTAGMVDLLPKLDAAGLNVKIVAALSHELFDAQPQVLSRRGSVCRRSRWIRWSSPARRCA